MLEVVADPKSTPLPLASHVVRWIDDLFKTSAYGFREIVLTCIAAWRAGIDFDPRVDFYKCNPRPVFEKGVRPALRAAGIPHMKSGPLNVAKNINKIDDDWAKGRRPESAAFAAVRILDWMLQGNLQQQKQSQDAVLDALLRRLLLEASRLQALSVTPRTDFTLYTCWNFLMSFVTQAPDAGNTPQVVVGLILQQLFRCSSLTVWEGGKACETNLTAKKPADIWIEGQGGAVEHLYEVTVKPIDQNRIQDSADSVLTYGKSHNEVVWLCRLPADIAPLGIVESSVLEYKGIRFEFVDLAKWMLGSLEILGVTGRLAVFERLNKYVDRPETSENAKKVWQQLNCRARELKLATDGGAK